MKDSDSDLPSSLGRSSGVSTRLVFYVAGFVCQGARPMPKLDCSQHGEASGKRTRQLRIWRTNFIACRVFGTKRCWTILMVCSKR